MDEGASRMPFVFLHPFNELFLIFYQTAGTKLGSDEQARCGFPSVLSFLIVQEIVTQNNNHKVQKDLCQELIEIIANMEWDVIQIWRKKRIYSGCNQ